MKAEHRRPFGVIILVVFQLLTVGSLIIDLYQGNQRSFTPLLPIALISPNVPTVAGVLVFQLIVAVGLWLLKRWAWFLIMIQLGIGMSYGLWFYFNDTPWYLYMVYAVIMVFYLNLRDVQQAFERRSTAEDMI